MIPCFTTSLKDAGNSDGPTRQYIYASEDNFTKMVQEGLFIEWGRWQGEYYGIRKTDFEAVKQSSKYPLVVTNIVTAQFLKNISNDLGVSCVDVFCVPKVWGKSFFQGRYV